MAGISTKAANVLENRRKFNEETELNSDFNINLYETNYRSLDPQIGRFWQIDPLSEEFEDLSPYSYAYNNPILFNDPMGLAPGDTSSYKEIIIDAPRKNKPEDGQVMERRNFLLDFFLGQRKWNGYDVDSKGYLVLMFGSPVKSTQLTSPDLGVKSNATKSAGKFVNKWLVYRSYKKINGQLRLYIGKAKNSLVNRYSKKEIDDMMVQVINKLDELPDNATALGVEQAVLMLNGGLESTANIKNAAVKKVYVEAGLKWLENNIPNWREVFKFQ
ncbi:MAG: hypothetical protein GXC73_12900 [Chitinophagaceae bacterium]|nr:hypothetical protein [Chitinophagaceae bacterium]